VAGLQLSRPRRLVKHEHLGRKEEKEKGEEEKEKGGEEKEKGEGEEDGKERALTSKGIFPLWELTILYPQMGPFSARMGGVTSTSPPCSPTEPT
jgi:hypothetical protein